MLSLFFFSFMYDKGEREDSNNSRDIGQEASPSWQITFQRVNTLLWLRKIMKMTMICFTTTSG